MVPSFFVHLVESLPRLRTRVQLFGLVVTVGAFIAVRTIAPNAMRAQISAGAIGVAFIVFGQVFSVLKDFPEKHRAGLILALFVVFCGFVISLIYATSKFVVAAATPVQMRASVPVGWQIFLNNYGKRRRRHLLVSLFHRARLGNLHAYEIGV
jgi:hypothetical protein